MIALVMRATLWVPTLVIGSEASIFSFVSQQSIADQISAAEGGSHFMCWGDPGKFNAAVLGFLE